MWIPLSRYRDSLQKVSESRDRPDTLTSNTHFVGEHLECSFFIIYQTQDMYFLHADRDLLTPPPFSPIHIASPLDTLRLH